MVLKPANYPVIFPPKQTVVGSDVGRKNEPEELRLK